jgi:hypothetical protein
MRTHRRVITAAAVPVYLAALAGAEMAGGADAGLRSGLNGHVLYGPTCPVQRAGQSCERPYQATIRVLRDPSRKLAATVRSPADGTFHVRLAPGRYLLEPQNGRPFPTSRPQTVAVHPHRYTNVVIRYDSGIR